MDNLAAEQALLTVDFGMFAASDTTVNDCASSIVNGLIRSFDSLGRVSRASIWLKGRPYLKLNKCKGHLVLVTANLDVATAECIVDVVNGELQLFVTLLIRETGREC